MYPFFKTISSDFFECNFDSSFKDLVTDFPRFKLPVYNLFCAANYNYQIPFEAINFELSDNLMIKVLQDNDNLINQYTITKINQNQGYFEFSCKNRFSRDLSTIRLLISDQDNDFVTTFRIWRGCDSLSSVDIDNFSLDENSGIISLSIKPTGLPESGTYWCITKPDIKFTDENNKVLDVLFPKRPNIINYALMKRSGGDFMNHNEFALLNISFKGDLICTWTDTLSGISTQKSIPVDYTKV